MNDLIEALTILAKYTSEPNPTHCEHDVLYVVGIERDAVSAVDVLRLGELGFFRGEDDECWHSFRFGSA